jgi:hypothetical protein
MKPLFPLPLHRQGDFYYMPLPPTPPASPLRTAFYKWCGVWLDEQVIMQFLQNPAHKIELSTYMNDAKLTAVNLPKPVLLPSATAPKEIKNTTSVVEEQEKPTLQVNIPKQETDTPVQPYSAAETASETLNGETKRTTTGQPNELTQPTRSYSLKGYDLESLKNDRALCSISASPTARMAFMGDYIPNGFPVLPESDLKDYILQCQSTPNSHKTVFTALQAVGLLADKLFDYDWIINGDTPVGIGFFQYQPAVFSFKEFWVKYMFLLENKPEPGHREIYILSRQLEVLVNDERFIRHSSSLAGRLLLLRMAQGIPVKTQSAMYKVEPGILCRAADDNYFLLQQALKCNGEMAGKYWLKTGKGLPGATFLSKLYEDTDWLMEADIQLHKEQLANPELPPAPSIVVQVTRFCTNCKTPIYGAGQKKYCSPACQQRGRRKMNKPGSTANETGSNGNKKSQEGDKDAQAYPEFLKLVLDLLSHSSPKKHILNRVERILRTNNQSALADMVADPEKRKYLLEILLQRLSG